MSNIVFMGTPQFAVPILKKINQKYKINCVFTQPPSKSNRGQKFTKSSIHICAEELNLEVKTPKKIDEEYEYLKELNLDLVIVVAYGQLISKKILDLSKKGFLNIHASLLPKWRGAAPIQRSILNNEKITGISFMKINEKLDSGPVCNKYSLHILDRDNAETLSEKLSNLSANKISENIKKILSDQATFEDQDDKLATYAKKINKDEGQINWKEDANLILAKINGLYPQPGGWFKYKNNRYKILKAKLSEDTKEPGEIIGNDLTISCGNNSIKVIKIQREGKKPQFTEDFVLGSSLKKGVIVNND
mgnify:CR=1 FL=1